MSEEPRVLGGRYEVGGLIGRGGMAEVHVGHDLRLGRTVAIKILRTDLARDTSFLARFRREAQSAAGLNHPAIVAVYDSGEQEHHESGGAPVMVPYIVMEHVEGKTLRQVLNDEKVLDPDEAARITASVLSALEYSHQRGIVHRDIKPANVMVTRGGAVKVMDFGIARALADTAATMTQTQAVLGTARYLSPEQAQGLDVDTRSDLYSAGCLFYELLTGRTPFVGDPVSLVYQHIGEQPKAPSTIQQDLGPAMDAVALHALGKSPDTRYQTAAAFRDDLHAARAGRPVSADAQETLRRVGYAAGVVGMAAQTPLGQDQPTEAIPRTGPPQGAARATPPAGQGPPEGHGPAYRDDFESTDEIPVREERHGGGWLVLTMLALLALAGIGWVVFQVLGPNGDDPEEPIEVTVPDVVGRTEAQAVEAITNANLVADVSYENDDEAKGRVIEQTPTGNARADEGSTVELVVSQGPDSITVPDVRDFTEQAARARLGSFNLLVADEVEEENNPEFDKGRVIRTEPPTGEAAAPDEEVVLVLASGKVEVPDVVGDNANQAFSQLSNDFRLEVEIEYQDSAEVEENTVLEQSLDPDAEVDYGTEIVLTVSRTPPETVTRTESVTVTQPPPTTDPEEPTDTDPPTTTGPPDDPTGTDPPGDSETITFGPGGPGADPDD
ncbi:Stk1 family PASTA domain-containing Ser/Thr kinase [Ornithinicoccus hortensis]|uniref:non-specific serine/threonine protein kinase n=1 Tax=Ornithinicoccus hortensis TaxID=82346 RepID=A0A542YMY0_9MICO|nr:Stk1 family PASTA domain-containing Ser/Thr kinase [Ornithinicoccus hortensis]TQL49462.1 serine/threonine-protein kinase [Ornithinicoccus hortensis]